MIFLISGDIWPFEDLLCASPVSQTSDASNDSVVYTAVNSFGWDATGLRAAGCSGTQVGQDNFEMPVSFGRISVHPNVNVIDT